MNSHYEFAIGSFLNDDELFEKAKNSLNPEKFWDSDLKTLISIMKQHGNSMEAIYKAGGRDIAAYAMKLANHVAAHKFEHKKHLPIQPFSEWCEKVFFKKDYDYDEGKDSPFIAQRQKISEGLAGIHGEEKDH